MPENRHFEPGDVVRWDPSEQDPGDYEYNVSMYHNPFVIIEKNEYNAGNRRRPDAYWVGPLSPHQKFSGTKKKGTWYSYRFRKDEFLTAVRNAKKGDT